MLTQKKINDFLLVVILHVLLVKSTQGFQTVIHDAFEVSATGSGDIRVGGSCACVMLGDVVSVVCPSVLEVHHKVITLLGGRGFHDRVSS